MVFIINIIYIIQREAQLSLH